MDIGLQELKEGLKEKGLTQSELDSLGETTLRHYLDDLNDEIQTDFEKRVESVINDIQLSHLAPTLWIGILQRDHYAGPDVDIGMEIGIILQQHDEDILHLAKSLEQKSGKIVTILPFEYAEIFVTELKRMISKVHTVRQHAMKVESGRSRSLNFKQLHYSDIERVNIDEEFKKENEDEYDDIDDEDDDEEARTSVHIGR